MASARKQHAERPLLWPLVPAYAAVLGLKNMAYAQGWLRPQQLHSPVISVGNLSVGGAGKTPLVIYLAQLLASRGIGADVLSRGYGRTSKETLRVDPQGSAAEYGDEPLMIARGAGVPVFVGASRFAAGMLAEQSLLQTAVAGGPRPHVHLLDDGFQHRQLARSADIVILHGDDLHAALMPAGRLREPLSALRRATAIVVRASAPAHSHKAARVKESLRGQGIQAPLWTMRRELMLPLGLSDRPAVAFCGIAHPVEFFRSLAILGVALAGTLALRDHHRFTDRDVETLLALTRSHGVALLLTTEKDLVRLSPEHQARLREQVELVAVPLRAILDEEDAVMSLLLEAIARPRRDMREGPPWPDGPAECPCPSARS